MPKKPPPDFDALMADLKSSDWKVRAEAARVLGQKKHQPAVELLIELLQHDKSQTVRSRVGVALGNIRDPRAVEPLLAVGWLDQMPKFGEAAVPALKRILNDRSQQFSTRCVVINTLAAIGGEAARSAIIAAAWDDEVAVRAFVAEALGKCGANQESFEALLLLLRDPVPMVGGAAIQSLGALRDERAIGILVHIFQGDRPFESDFALFCSATNVLRQWAGVRGKTVDELEASLQDAAPLARIAAALSLVWLRDERAIEPLRAATQDTDSLVRHAAEWSLKSLERIVSLNLPFPPIIAHILLN